MKKTPRKDSFNLIAAVVIDHQGVRMLSPLVDVDALTLIGCAAEDPAEWNDVALVWPRYVFHENNTEFADGLPMCETDLPGAVAMLADSDAWFAIDLKAKRLSAGGDVPELQLRGDAVDDDGPPKQMIVLPPWWELHQHVTPDALLSERSSNLAIPRPRRDMLWGSAMTEFVASAMIDAVRGGDDWLDKDREGNPRGSYDLTVRIHRDWLMTPRADLDGDIPRDCLHGGSDWISELVDGQTYRVYDGKVPIPVPMELSTYETAPIGRHEMILYFEACRETISAGWQWLIDNPSRIEDAQATPKLAAALDSFLERWLNHSFEGSLPPAEVIRCDRVRIPLVDNGGEHVIDCDCPICEMMADGMFGPSICHFDGHQLELDDEFAFSMHAEFEDWEAEQASWAEMKAGMEADGKAGEEEQESGDGESDDGEFSPVWKNSLLLSAEGIPGDVGGQLGLAFLVADMVGSLQETGGATSRCRRAECGLSQLSPCP